MTEELELAQGKTIGDLGSEAMWFAIHTLLAVLCLGLILLGGMIVLGRGSDSQTPKLIGTVLAFAIPMAGGFIVARIQRNIVAKYVWISGVLVFLAVCVWVIDLPTGPGLCEECTTGHILEKLWRTFFDINHGSGLLGGDGLLVGCWLPLCMFGYAAGASLALSNEE